MLSGGAACMLSGGGVCMLAGGGICMLSGGGASGGDKLTRQNAHGDEMVRWTV